MTHETRRRSSLGALLAAALLLASLPASSASAAPIHHRAFMKGKVLEVSGADVVFCIGSPNRAEVGQALPVFKRIWGISAARSPWSQWRRVKTGQVRIDAIVDGHMATATLVSGWADVGARVELAESKGPWHGPQK